MQQVVVTPHHKLEQLHLLADSQPIQGCLSLAELLAEAYKTDPVPGKILEAIRANNEWRDITIAEFQR